MDASLTEKLTTEDIARHVGRSETAIKGWLNDLALDIPRDSRGRRRFSPEHLEIFERIKDLKENGSGNVTIRRVLGVETDAKVSENRGEAVASSGDTSASISTADSRPNAALARVLELLAERDRQLGELLADQKALNERLLSTSAVAAQYQERATNLAAELAKKDEEIKLLSAPLAPTDASVPHRPWWRLWR